MAKLRFLGAEPHDVKGPLNRTVDPDELVEIDDGEFDKYAWPESLWAVDAAPKKSTAKDKG